jgi:hypothetical protein
MPETAEGRATLLAEQFPATADGVVMVDDWARFRKTARAIQSRLNDVVPVADLPSRFTQEYLGVDLQSPKSWKKAGLAPDGGGAVAWLNNHPVVAVFATDAPAFESHLTETIAPKWGRSNDSSPSVRTRSVDGEKVKYVTLEDGELAWTWRGKLALVVLPNPAAETSSKDGDLFSSFGHIEKKDSLASHAGYTDFRAALDKPPFTAFAPPSTLTDRLGQALPVDSVAGITGYGFTLEHNDAGLRGRTWIGLTDGARSLAASLRGTGSEDVWRDLATEQTLLGLRATSNVKSIWENVQTSEHPEVVHMRDVVDRWSKRLGIEFGPGVVEPMAGHLGVFFYGIAPDLGLQEFNRAPFRGIKKVGLIAAAKLDDPKRFAETLETVAKAIDGMELTESGEMRILTARAVDGSKETQIPGLVDGEVPLKLYLHGDTVAVATTAFSEESIKEYVTGTREEAGSLAGRKDLDLGARFASDATLNGVYLNMVRTREHLGDRLPSLPALDRALAGVQEILLSDSLSENGVFIDLNVHLSQTPSE